MLDPLKSPPPTHIPHINQSSKNQCLEEHQEINHHSPMSKYTTLSQAQEKETIGSERGNIPAKAEKIGAKKRAAATAVGMSRIERCRGSDNESEAQSRRKAQRLSFCIRVLRRAAVKLILLSSPALTWLPAAASTVWPSLRLGPRGEGVMQFIILKVERITDYFTSFYSDVLGP